MLYRASQLRKRFAKLRRRATDDSLKRAIEVRHGLKSTCEGSFADSRIGIEQKRLRFLDSAIAELRQQIHDDLRIQHPEWIEPNGDCPECDFYEARLMEELDTLKGSDESIAAIHPRR